MKIIELFSEIKSGNVSKVKELCSANANLVNQYLYGVTPLLYSIECNQAEVAVALCSIPDIDLSLCDNLNTSPLERAIETRSFKIVDEIVRRTKKTQLNNWLIDDVETLLTSSLKSGDDEISIALINGGVDINRPNKNEEYPLELTIRYNKVKVLNALLKRPLLNLDRLGNGFCPLLESCANDLTECALLLIDSVTDLNIRHNGDDQKWTPLMHAIANNNEILVSRLVEKGADLNVVDLNGNSPLHMAVLNDNESILELLLKNNANKALLNSENLTPADLAKLNESEECLKFLLKIENRI